MPRSRPPRERSSPYITPAGFAALDAELKVFWSRRTGVVQALAAAAAEGDRSENAEYIYRKRELAGIDRRIRYLQKRLPELKVVREHPAGERVFFGARVRLAADDGTEAAYRIVGADEAAGDAISVDSPLARALLRRTVGDEVEVTAAAGTRRYRVLAVRYGDDGSG